MHSSTTYHIYNHANGHDDLFREKANYPYFLNKWREYINPIARTYAYCLMPNHFHFLIKTHDESLLAALMEKKRNNNKQNLEGLPPRGHKNSNDILASLESNKPISLTNLRGLTYYSNEKISKYLSQQFSNLFNGYTKAINKRYRRYGSLFAPRFKRKEINSENYFYNTLVYIHFNPIHHRFVYDLDDWPYSSWHDYLSEQSWIDSSWIESNFESRTEFLNLHKPLNKSTLSRITKELES